MTYSKKVSAILLALILIITTFGTSIALADGEYTLSQSTKIYTSAADAKAGTNSVGTYSAGTYNIYREYDGMLNISKYSGAGAWINPSSTSSSYLTRYSLGVNVRSQASGTSTKLGYLSRGTKIEGTISGSWFKFNYNGSTAYASLNYLSISQPSTVGGSLATRYSLGVNVRSQAYSTASKVGYLSKGTKIQGTDLGNWFKFTYNGSTAYASEKYLSTSAPSVYVPDTTSTSRGQKVANYAASKAGSRYVYGTAGPYTFDCSGLTSYSYKQVLGISLYRSSRDQYRNGYSVSFSNLKPGDLIFFGGSASSIYHVAMYIGNRKMVHASTPERGVVIDSVDSNWVKNNYYGIKRIVD